VVGIDVRVVVVDVVIDGFVDVIADVIFDKVIIELGVVVIKAVSLAQ
jgi:hypothetical protein